MFRRSEPYTFIRSPTTTAEVRPFTIEMASDGALTINGDQVTLQELEARLTSEPVAKEPKAVVIKADKRLLYGKVVEVMGVCQAAGVDEIAVAVK